ncbi:MAG: alpha/beta hydrolase [Lachnospiraceae bacterium]|nr:alpha/beta hydrolase [Lachnospiraceae bacterium]
MKKSRQALKILVVILIALMAIAVIYLNIFYRADESADNSLQNPVETVTVSTGDKAALIFEPSYENNAARTGIIFYPGGKVECSAYAPLMEKLAQRGMTAVLVPMPGNLAILDTNRAKGFKEAFSEIEDWYMAGHSLGGAAAAIHVAKNPDEYEGLILLGAYSTKDLSQDQLPVLSIYGREDEVMNREKYEANKNFISSDLTEIEIAGGCHAYFGSYGEQKGDGTATITPEEQQTITADAIADWIQNRAA